MSALIDLLILWLPRIFWSIIIGFTAWATIVSIFDPKGLPKVKNLIYNWTSAAVGLFGRLVGDAAPGLQVAAQAIVDAANAHGGGLMAVFRAPAAALAETVFKEQFDALATNGLSTPDNATQTASLAMGTAFGRGVASAAVTAAFEATFPEKLNTLNGAGPMLAKMAGFDEVAARVLEPLYANAFGKSLEYAFRAQFKPELPDEADAVRWHARRLLNDDQLRAVFAFSGLKDQYETPYIASAYNSVSPRVLATLFEDTPFPRDDISHMMEFSGVRPLDLPILLDAFERATTKNVRHQYLSALLIAAERGTLDDTDLDASLDGLNFSTDAKNYVHLTVNLRRLEQLAELYRKQVTSLYETGQIGDNDYVPALTAIGIADADAEAHFAVDSARLKGRQLAAQQRAEERAAETLQRQQIAGIRQEYLNS